MEEKIEIFEEEQLEKLDVPTLKFIHQETKTFLGNLIDVSRRIGERSYSLFGVITATFSLLIALMVYSPSDYKIVIVVMLSGFIASVWNLVKAIRVFRSGLLGMTPDEIQKHIQWDALDLQKDALLLVIYTYQYRINRISALNKKRSEYYMNGLYYLMMTCFLTGILILLF